MSTNGSRRRVSGADPLWKKRGRKRARFPTKFARGAKKKKGKKKRVGTRKAEMSDDETRSV